MRTELPCEIVQDLLPSYIDELTSDVTREAVDAHLSGCEECSKKYRFMTTGEDMTEKEQKTADQKEVDYLKKAKKHGRNTLLGGILLTAALILGVVFARLYLFADITPSYMMSFTIEKNINGFELYGNLIDAKMGVSKITWEETDGVLNIKVTSTRASFLHSNDFDDIYQPKGEITRVTINDTVVIWDNGEVIPAEIARTFSDITPYVGSMEAIGKLARDTGLSDYLTGHWTNELQTTTEPYGWTLHAEDSITESEFAEYENMLPRYAALLIATVKNLGYMEFDCIVDGELRTITVTEADADALFGSSVKAQAESPAALRELFSVLNAVNY